MDGWELLLLVFPLVILATVLVLVGRGKGGSERLRNGPQQVRPHGAQGRYHQPGDHAWQSVTYQQPVQQRKQPYWRANHRTGRIPARPY